jgi:hypothetical protein
MKVERMMIKPVSIIGDGSLRGPILSFAVGVKREQPKRAKQQHRTSCGAGKYRPTIIRSATRTELHIPARIIQRATLEAATHESLPVELHGFVFEVTIVDRLQRANRGHFELAD